MTMALKFKLVPPSKKRGFVVVEAVDSSDDGLCLVVNNSRVAGSPPSLLPNNILYRWNVRAEYLEYAARGSSRTEVDDALVRGYAAALAMTWTIGHHGSVVAEVASAAGLTLKKMRAAGVPQQDLANLRRAGVR